MNMNPEEKRETDEIEIDLFAELQLFKQLIRKNFIWIMLVIITLASKSHNIRLRISSP
jgi:hypothetical protein